ncbi:GNAT family N-acetyltransferase [Embleya sp. NBC_00896]|uniref:GNAT family N-acetyltransferase n=1 Tax=Embleya sp. NBC_00896 TaxID=2975961 RepID=UPI002F90FE9A|nr:GNAT family N-acetyltransferase [Embleya sp. NBC_00896]
MGTTITYLEMTSPDQLRPARPVPALGLRRIDADSPLVRSTPKRIGNAYGWRSSTRSDQEWREIVLAHPLRQFWLITHDGDTAGAGYLEPQPGGDVEITTFGLVPEFVGKGLGGSALALVIRQAWTGPPVDTDTVRRVWLHTSSRDHPNALINYQSRGLRPYRTEFDDSED